MDRLVKNWVYGGFAAGILLLLLTPLFARGWSAALTATYLCLPIYMIHQYEEHDRDRFRAFINANIGGDADVLTPGVVFLVNVPGVWGVIAVSLWLAAAANPGFGLIAAYLVLVNGVVHILPALGMRRYNPGLVTAIVLFVPVGGYCAWAAIEAGAGTMGYEVLGVGTAIAIHAALVVHVLARRRRMFVGRGLKG